MSTVRYTLNENERGVRRLLSGDWTDANPNRHRPLLLDVQNPPHGYPDDDPYTQFCLTYYENRGVSQAIAVKSAGRIMQFRAFTQFKPMNELQPSDFENYVYTLGKEGLEASTIIKIMRTFNPLWKWAVRNGYMTITQMRLIQMVEKPKFAGHQPRPYSEEEIAEIKVRMRRYFPVLGPQKLKQYLDGRLPLKKIENHVWGVQLDAMFHIMLYAGLRTGELLALEVRDVDPDSRGIAVRNAKGDINGSKFRIVPMADDLRYIIRRWLALRKAVFETEGREDKGNLWISCGSNGHTPATLDRVPIQTYYARWRKIEAEPHRLRHTCATFWLRAGVPLHQVQRILGHSAVKTTQIYTRVSGIDMAQGVIEHQDKFAELLDARGRKRPLTRREIEIEDAMKVLMEAEEDSAGSAIQQVQGEGVPDVGDGALEGAGGEVE